MMMASTIRPEACDWQKEPPCRKLQPNLRGLLITQFVQLYAIFPIVVLGIVFIIVVVLNILELWPATSIRQSGAAGTMAGLRHCLVRNQSATQ